MIKAELEKALKKERKKNDQLMEINDILLNDMNDLAVGLGRKRNGEWKASYLAADTLTKLAKRANR